eukprot:NODE_6586_length_1657_cov_17.934641.p1 GENE.NODE_6586_length_1657_cov_17.934641~~NODE_6586_length_1657_cov_17.934641.p1  ORF type:complete len:443 (+),score=62.68 NODE_6586_length_1657_cov_17.934641:67-1395(+)
MCLSYRCAAVATVVMATFCGGLKWLVTCPPLKTHPETGMPILERNSPKMPIVGLVDTLFETFKDRLVPTDLETLKKAAIEEVGADDFGDHMDWTWVPRWINVDRTFSGRLLFHQQITNLLVTHLQLTRLLKVHPEIVDEPIDRPIVITGSLRSGSTFMQSVLAYTHAHEKSFRFLKWWETCTRPAEEDAAKRRADAMQTWSAITWAAPGWSLVHEVQNVDQPEEEIVWTRLVLPSLLAAIETHDTFFHDAAHTKERARNRFKLLRRLLQVHQWREGRRYRWLLKSPEHLRNLDELGQEFPDVKLIVNFREPISTLKSHFVLVNEASALAGAPKAPSSYPIYVFCKNWLVLMALNQTTEFPFQQSWPVPHRLDMDFQYMISNQLKAIELVSKFADLPWDAAAQAAAEKAIAKHKVQRPTKYFYNLTEYGVDEAELPNLVKQCG